MYLSVSYLKAPPSHFLPGNYKVHDVDCTNWVSLNHNVWSAVSLSFQISYWQTSNFQSQLHDLHCWSTGFGCFAGHWGRSVCSPVVKQPRVRPVKKALTRTGEGCVTTLIDVGMVFPISRKLNESLRITANNFHTVPIFLTLQWINESASLFLPHGRTCINIYDHISFSVNWQADMF